MHRPRQRHAARAGESSVGGEAIEDRGERGEDTREGEREGEWEGAREREGDRVKGRYKSLRHL